MSAPQGFLAPPSPEEEAVGQSLAADQRERPTRAARLYLIDDDADMRESLALVLRSVGYEVQAFSQAQDFLEAFDPRTPAVAVVDLLLPGMSGLKLCAELLRNEARCKFVVISGHGDVTSVVAAMKLGAVDFLEKPFTRERLLSSVDQASRQSVQEARQYAAEEELEARLKLLTPQESRVFELIAAGLASKEIAARLQISRKTVDVHRCRIMHKLQVESPGQLGSVIALRARRNARRQPPAE